MNLAFLTERARPHLRDLASIAALSVASALATLAIPWLAGQFLAGAITGESADLRFLTALLLGVLAAMTAVNIAVAVLSEAASGRILSGLRAEAHARIQAMPMSFHDRSKSGDLLALMTYEVSNLSGFLTATLAKVPSMLFTAAGAVVLLFLIDPVMALVVPVLIPVFYIVMKLVGRRLRALSHRARKAESEVITTAARDLEMLSAIKAFAAEEHHRAQYREVIEKSRLLSLTRTRTMAFIGPVVALVAALAAIALLMIGGDKVASGARSPAELFTFLFYAALLTRPVEALVNIYGQWQIAKGTLARMDAVFTKTIEPGYAAPGRLERASGALAFEGVSFAYPGRAAVLSDFDLAIAPGEVIALTGENGIGKSTLVSLLLRFYEPQAGRITLDGVDIASLQVQDLRRQFGFVPQRALLFNGSIAENIAFGLLEPAPAAIEQAARLAQAWDFIQHLPRGLQTEIGDNGVRLSGGQRQRIALARALLRDPPIYIFDEATSMYDLEGEAAFVEACVESLKGRTVIIITHRPASLALADRVITVTRTGPIIAGKALSTA